MSNAYLPLPTYLETEPRYTTLAKVKEAVQVTSTDWDDQITQSIVALEGMIDAHLNTSYPQDADPNAGTDEALDPAPIEGIPIQIQQAALQGSIAVWKILDMPFGVGGSDDFVGELDFGSATRSAFRDQLPLLLGLQRGFPVA